MRDFTLAYIDDVNIYSSSFEKHLSHVDIVLKFLRHEISGKGITPTTTKVAASDDNRLEGIVEYVS
ncbi:13034_t:CDS:2 [Cetraspora pellucida]|uniref:13034_t:CDS:1 n=1 Tax=Cetraspora pellucida TaxID=1433469 RepID=A0A9N9HQV4_9GLOM|nr:13034_t:CDS:2 [Cetraspora pellucida]